MKRPTHDYASFDHAYDHFNAALFAGSLPHCLITLQRKANVKGYFSASRFLSRALNGNERTDEIALNPDTFTGRTDKEIMSTLVHEMCHLWQQHYGKPGRGKYHNAQWAEHMLSIGLPPVSLDKPGAMTGQAVTHEIVAGAAFDQACDVLIATGCSLGWQSSRSGTATKSKASKLKYTCPTCDQNSWAKPNANLICGDCMESMISEEEDQ